MSESTPSTKLLDTVQGFYKQYRLVVIALFAGFLAALGYWTYTTYNLEREIGQPLAEIVKPDQEPEAAEFAQAVPETTEPPMAHYTTPRPFSEDSTYGDYVKTHQREHVAHDKLHKDILPSPNAF